MHTNSCGTAALGCEFLENYGSALSAFFRVHQRQKCFFCATLLHNTVLIVYKINISERI